ncbi:UDP-N-acetylmuramoyl-L-alanyl-D-glutamate--2,6-diaminopimelate ligase [Bdellovibrionota bacterium FG-2]
MSDFDFLKAIRRLNPTRITSDSREVIPGCAFFAIAGLSQDGHQFIPTAKQQGAIMTVGEKPPADFIVPDSRLALAQAAAEFHHNPTHGMLVFGVTGTSGKTTTTYLIESILKAAGHKVGVIGTVNFRFDEKILPSTHTTPGPVELQALLAQMKSSGCTAVVMEVSSHALKQHRVACIAFDSVVFTNLSPEHLDFHSDMEDYYQSKLLLFTDCLKYSLQAGKTPQGAFNCDDSAGARMADDLKKDLSLSKISRTCFGIQKGELSGKSLNISSTGIEGYVGEIHIQSPLMGRFNASNILTAIAAVRGISRAPIKNSAIEAGLTSLQCVPGRLEPVVLAENPKNTGLPRVLVDYAHKPDALKNVLQTLREIRGAHRLLAVFGCGGDRDRLKRAVMGKTACEISDHVWVTSDNPRTEDPAAIINEILSGTVGYSNYSVEPDRKKAIFAAISEAKQGDLVLIAGKGHEDYQIIADPSKPGQTVKIHFDDREVCAEALRHT